MGATRGSDGEQHVKLVGGGRTDELSQHWRGPYTDTLDQGYKKNEGGGRESRGGGEGGDRTNKTKK